MGYGAPPGYPETAPDADIEKQALKSQADALKAEMNAIRKRLDDLEAGTPAE
jgi:hypothetical protein